MFNRVEKQEGKASQLTQRKLVGETEGDLLTYESNRWYLESL